MCIAKVAVTIESGIISVGIDTLPIRAALALIEFDDRSMDSENAVHGQKATAR